MKDIEKVRILDDIILNLEIVQERAAVMAGNIDQDYFALNDDYYKLYYFDKAGIELDILLDYIIQLGDKLKETRKKLREWRVTSEEKGGAVCQSE